MRRTAAVLLLLAVTPGVRAAEDDLRFFDEKVQPLLKLHCYACHSHAAGKIKGGLTLDSRSGWEKGGQIGTGHRAARGRRQPAHQGRPLQGRQTAHAAEGPAP
jgi:hypothetical protein